MVGPPKVINKKVDDKLQEPYEVIFFFSLLLQYVGGSRYVYSQD